jgi:hypothetical protein
VDSADDTIRRYVVHLHIFDQSDGKRRSVEVASFDNAAEALRCFAETRVSVLSRQMGGETKPCDHVTMLIKEPGADKRSRQRGAHASGPR